MKPARAGLITLLGGLAFASMGMNTSLVSFALLGMRGEWQLTPRDVSVIIASAGLGQLVGSILLGNLSDRFGRKGAYLVSVGFQTAFTGLVALAPATWAACVFLFLAGVGQGGAAPVVTSLVAESAPSTSRGRMVGVTELMFASGWAVAALLARTLADASSWRLLMAVGGVPLFLVPLGIWQLTPARTMAPAGGLTSNPGALWHPHLRSRTVVMWLLWLAIFGAWFGPVIWLPTLLAGIGDSNPAGKGSLVAVAMLAGASLVLLVIDRWGRRTMVVPGLVVMAAACCGMALSANGNLLAAAGVALGFAGQCIWPVCLTYSAEIYPTAVRGLGVGWALGAGRLGAMLAPLALGALLTSFGQAAALLPFAALCAAAAVVVFRLGPETAGHDLHPAARELVHAS